MQEGTLPTMVPKTTKTPFYASTIILGAMIIATIGLLFTNSSLASRADELSQEIATKKGAINEVSKDRNVMVAHILSTNTVPPTINLRGLIASFRDVAAKANVDSKDLISIEMFITTSLIATEGNPNIHPDPASTIVTMMRAYAPSNGDGTFTLEPIRAITGDSKSRSTSITLKVVPNTTK